MRPASEAEKERLGRTFAELCRIPSPFGAERPHTDRVAAELHGMGLEVAKNDAAKPAGASSNNLLAHINGRSDRSILLCAHLNTVEVSNKIEPMLIDGG